MEFSWFRVTVGIGILLNEFVNEVFDFLRFVGFGDFGVSLPPINGLQ